MSEHSLSRRALLAGTAAAAALMSDLPHIARAATADPVFRSFEAARKTKPWTLGLVTPKQHRMAPTGLKILSGAVPKDMRGTFYRNGPAINDRAEWRYRHWFDGDGMIQAFRIADGKIEHRGRVIETPKYRKEQEAGRFLYMAFGSMPPDNLPPRGPDEINTANTSLLPMGEDLLALWEGGTATRVDPESLAYRGSKVWREDLAGVPFSAHPKVEADGTVWNFGSDPFGSRLVIYKIGASGGLSKAALIDVPQSGMIHDFVITRTKLVFLIPSFVVDKPIMPFVDSFRWDGSLSMKALVVDKDDFSRRKLFELPPGFQFHFGNAWEDKDGTVRLDVARSRDGRWIMDGAKAMMRGEYIPAIDPAQMTVVTLPAKGEARLETFDQAVEFTRIDERRTGDQHRFTYSVGGDDPAMPGATEVLAWDWRKDAYTRHTYGADYMVEEHIFVPRPGGSGEQDGWLIGTALNLKKKRTEVAIFDAARISSGPVCVAALDKPLPLGFHGIWWPA